MPNPGFIRGGERHRGNIAGVLGQALGQGLGEFTGQYMAEKALQEAKDKPEYKEGSLSERLGLLNQATSRYGERGAKMFKNEAAIQQQAEEEFLQGIIYKHQRGEELTPDEAKRLSKDYQIENLKAKNKVPAGGITGQPISPEMGNLINQTLNANKDATAEELGSAFALVGVPPVYSSPYIETRRRQDEAKAKPGFAKTEKAISRDSEVLKKLDEERATIPQEEAALEVMKDSIVNGDQSFWSLNNLAEQTGSELFRDAKGGNFKTAAKTFLINTIGKIGARPNQYIEQQIADSLAKVGRSEEANLGSIAILEFDKDIKKKYSEIIDRLEEEGDYKPGSLGRTAQKELQDYAVQRQQELSDELTRLALQEKMKTEKKEIPEQQEGFDSLPDPAVHKGRKIQGPNGKFQSDGTRWVPIP